jgi:O-antigen ligase
LSSENLLWLLPLLLLARLTVLVRQRAAEQSQTIDGSAGLQIVLVLAAFAALFVLTSPRRLAKMIARSSIAGLVGFYILGLLSALWSPLPAFTAYRAFEYLSQVLIIFAALSCSWSLEKAESRFLKITLLVVLLQIVGALKLSGWRVTSLGSYHSVTFGLSAGMGACYAFGEAFSRGGKKGRRFLLVGFFFSFFVFLSTSASSIVATAIAFFMLALLSRRLRLAVMALVATGLLFLVPSERLKSVMFPDKDDKMISSMSGRKAMWEGFFSLIEAKPFLGYGMSIGARYGGGSYNINSHNAFLAVLLSAGALGAGVVISTLAALMVECYRNWALHRSGALGCAAAMIMAFVNSNTIAFFGEDWCTPSHTFVCLWALHALFVCRRPNSPTPPTRRHLTSGRRYTNGILPKVIRVQS